MANPLARVVMNSIAQKSGKVEERPSNTSAYTTNSNLGKRETQLLSSLLNNKKSTKTSSSYNKETYGRTTNVSNSSRTMQTLNSLVSGKAGTEKKGESCEIKSSSKDLKSLCSLDNISVGKSNVKTSKNSSRNVMQKLSLDDLVKGDNKSIKQESKTSYKKQTSGMTTLGDFAKDKSGKSHGDDTAGEKKDNRTNSNVRSNVINNLEAYIPKVTLESIGKKGSLF